MLSVPTFALLWMEEVSVLETRGVLCLLKKTTTGMQELLTFDIHSANVGMQLSVL